MKITKHGTVEITRAGVMISGFHFKFEDGEAGSYDGEPLDMGEEMALKWAMDRLQRFATQEV